jgi:hypothetical protein
MPGIEANVSVVDTTLLSQFDKQGFPFLFD